VRSLTIRVPGITLPRGKYEARPPGANELIRMGHWRIGDARGRWKVATEIAAAEAVREWGAVERRFIRDESWEPLEHCIIGVTWRCKTKRRRDFDNLVSGLKPLLDGLVSSGVIRDDSTDCLMMLGPLRVEVGWDTDVTILEVLEAGPDGRHRADGVVMNESAYKTIRDAWPG
jgi:hypothetical protein